MEKFERRILVEGTVCKNRKLSVIVRKDNFVNAIKSFVEDMNMCSSRLSINEFYLNEFLVEAKDGHLNLSSTNPDFPVVVGMDAEVFREGASLSSPFLFCVIEGMKSEDFVMEAVNEGICLESVEAYIS